MKKKKMITSVTFSMALLHKMGACALFLWFCCEEVDGSNVVTFLYGGGVMEKVMAKCSFFPLFFYNFFVWCFWFNSLELIISNDVGFLFC
jgi:hypothetical protein